MTKALEAVITHVQIDTITVEHYSSALGIETSSPRLSWSFKGNAEDWLQTRHEISVQRGEAPTERYSELSADSVLIPWPFAPLKSRDIANVQVRVMGTDGLWTEWKGLRVEAGLLKESDWKTQPVTCPAQPPDVAKRPFRARQSFTVNKVSSARLYITALGLYEPYLNGQRIGKDLFTPGWTSYYARLPYQTYDVTDLLVEGENILGAWVGEGWYAGNLGYGGGKRNIYGERPALLAQLEINGQEVKGDWEWSYGALLGSEIYNGETYDTNLPNDFLKGDWRPAETIALPQIRLFSSQSPPVRIIQHLQPQGLITTPSGKLVVDFGQNFAGVIQILNDPPPSTEQLVIRHAEVLEYGELGVRPLRHAKATETIVLGGSSIRGYMAKFTFHGFRYAEVTGWPGLKLSDIQGVVFHSAMQRTGDFSCSHGAINRLYQNCIWSTIANTISIPSDCPQRNERLGWTGDINVFSPTMSYMFNTSGFLSEWLVDLEHDQRRLGGVVPIFCPDTGTDTSTPEAIWGDAAVLTPYDTYIASGDRGLLERQFEAVKLWLEDGVVRKGDELWARDKDQLADWLAPKAPPETPNMGPTDNFLVADAWLIHSTKTAGKIAEAIGRPSESDQFAEQAARLTQAFYGEYVTSTGRVVGETQTALCLLLRYDIFPSSPSIDYRSLFSNRLAQLVARANFLVDTGFAGTPIILQTLAASGNLSHAYRMLQSSTCPSWLACVLLGATTIWERWDSQLVDGRINPGEMTSFNHYALGSVASFMYEVIGGLSPLSPGWKEILVKPQPGGTITRAKTSHRSPYGRVAVEWNIRGGEFEMTVDIPPNCSARIVLPGQGEEGEMIGSGKRQFLRSYQLPAFPPPTYAPHFASIRPNDWI